MAYCWESECEDPEYKDPIHIKPYPGSEGGDGESTSGSGE